MWIPMLCFTLIIISAMLLYFYSNFKLIYQTRSPESNDTSMISPLEIAKQRQSTFRLLRLRLFSPLLGVFGAIFGIGWFSFHYGLLSVPLGLFLLILIGCYFVLKGVLVQLLVLLLQKLYPKKP